MLTAEHNCLHIELLFSFIILMTFSTENYVLSLCFRPQRLSIPNHAEADFATLSDADHDSKIHQQSIEVENVHFIFRKFQPSV